MVFTCPAVSAVTILLIALVVSRSRYLPTPYPDRLAVIDRAEARIDNSFYSDVTWWNESEVIYTLRRMNTVRAPYFHRHLSRGGKVPSNGRYLDARHHGRHLPNLHYQVGSAYEIPFPDNSFDGVIISDVLEHLLDLRAALSEIHRVLEPGGVLVFDTISRTLKSYALLWLISQELLQIMYEDAHDWRLFITPEEVTRLLEETGFLLEHGWTGMDFKDVPLGILRYIANGMTEKSVVFGGGFVEVPDDFSMIYAGSSEIHLPHNSRLYVLTSVFESLYKKLKDFLLSERITAVSYLRAAPPQTAVFAMKWSTSGLVVGGIGALLGWFHQSRYNPTPYPDRLAVIEKDDAEIDNQLYDGITWWDPEGFAFAMRRMNTVRAPFFHRHLSRGGKVPSNGRYLDVGCGGGLLTEEMASTYGYNITGIDISEASLQQARQHINNLSNLSFEKGTIYSIPFPDNSFDGVIVSDVFEHLLDLRKAATEVYRVLKPGGVLVFDTVARTRLTYAHYWLTMQEILKVLPPDIHDWRLFINPSEMKALLTWAGFSISSDVRNRIRLTRLVLPKYSQSSEYVLSGFTSVKSFSKGFVELPEDLSYSYCGVAMKPTA
ncbi:Hexaprenyldihydroxybenzoate methyltransferase, mitochondrial [Perkinsus olseni]|uniref:Hexaprenyldihydroxybenzoate methyltransferase, mitochondrial n=1 Tax=Perkinsus olseni TaxID=32597 RepID=A0A7J6P1Q9_PEROL|nr:Hexaprenyldihydroxybenzoate methyltransferase, mitochondrial [Perkinsus olseni]